MRDLLELRSSMILDMRRKLMLISFVSLFVRLVDVQLKLNKPLNDVLVH